ncbi:hypothetical protein SB861_29665 [Paraburkholderia sp. SIMBA_049]
MRNVILTAATALFIDIYPDMGDCSLCDFRRLMVDSGQSTARTARRILSVMTCSTASATLSFDLSRAASMPVITSHAAAPPKSGSSSQVTGIDTGSPGLARGDKATVVVAPFPFRRSGVSI